MFVDIIKLVCSSVEPVHKRRLYFVGFCNGVGIDVKNSKYSYNKIN